MAKPKGQIIRISLQLLDENKALVHYARAANFLEADNWLKDWASKVTESGHGVCLFCVTFSNRKRYAGTFRFVREDGECDELFGPYIRHCIEFLAGELCPPWWTKEMYRGFIDQCVRPSARKLATMILKECEI